jgi:hypothetical protein
MIVACAEETFPSRGGRHGYHAARSPPTRLAFSFMRSPIIGNFLRTLATPEPIQGLVDDGKEKLIKISAKIVSHGRYVAFQMAEICLPTSCG